MAESGCHICGADLSAGGGASGPAGANTLCATCGNLWRDEQRFNQEDQVGGKRPSDGRHHCRHSGCTKWFFTDFAKRNHEVNYDAHSEACGVEGEGGASGQTCRLCVELHHGSATTARKWFPCSLCGTFSWSHHAHAWMRCGDPECQRWFHRKCVGMNIGHTVGPGDSFLCAADHPGYRMRSKRKRGADEADERPSKAARTGDAQDASAALATAGANEGEHKETAKEEEESTRELPANQETCRHVDCPILLSDAMREYHECTFRLHTTHFVAHADDCAVCRERIARSQWDDARCFYCTSIARYANPAAWVGCDSCHRWAHEACALVGSQVHNAELAHTLNARVVCRVGAEGKHTAQGFVPTRPDSGPPLLFSDKYVLSRVSGGIDGAGAGYTCSEYFPGAEQPYGLIRWTQRGEVIYDKRPEGSFQIGETVVACYPNMTPWWTARVTAVKPQTDTPYYLLYEDGDTAWRAAADIRRITPIDWSTATVGTPIISVYSTYSHNRRHGCKKWMKGILAHKDGVLVAGVDGVSRWRPAEHVFPAQYLNLSDDKMTGTLRLLCPSCKDGKPAALELIEDSPPLPDAASALFPPYPKLPMPAPKSRPRLPSSNDKNDKADKTDKEKAKAKTPKAENTPRTHRQEELKRQREQEQERTRQKEEDSQKERQRERARGLARIREKQEEWAKQQRDEEELIMRAVRSQLKQREAQRHRLHARGGLEEAVLRDLRAEGCPENIVAMVGPWVVENERYPFATGQQLNHMAGGLSVEVSELEKWLAAARVRLAAANEALALTTIVVPPVVPGGAAPEAAPEAGEMEMAPARQASESASEDSDLEGSALGTPRTPRGGAFDGPTKREFSSACAAESEDGAEARLMPRDGGAPREASASPRRDRTERALSPRTPPPPSPGGPVGEVVAQSPVIGGPLPSEAFAVVRTDELDDAEDDEPEDAGEENEGGDVIVVATEFVIPASDT